MQTIEQLCSLASACNHFLTIIITSNKQKTMNQKNLSSSSSSSLSVDESAIAILKLISDAISNEKNTPEANNNRNSTKLSVIAVVGAGVSTAAGIPDFSTDNSIYDKTCKLFHLKNREDLFSIRNFQQNPVPFYTMLPTMASLIQQAQPTTTHLFLKTLNDRGLLKRIYTQNIDSLEEKAGIAPDKIVYCHGNMKSACCASCHHVIPNVRHLFDVAATSEILCCDICSGYIKPDIVFYDEPLSSEFGRFRQLDFLDTDHDEKEKEKENVLLLVLGTSLTVQPVADLVFLNETHKITHKLVVSKTPYESYIMNRLHASRASVVLQECDAFVQLIAKDQMGVSQKCDTE